MEDPAIIVRRINQTDMAAVREIDAKIGKGQGLIGDGDIARAELGGPLDMSLVAEDEGRVVGVLFSRRALLMLPLGEVCLMQTILVDPDYQRHHVGSKLITALPELCSAAGIKNVRALVEERNEGLRRTVERLGFKSSRIVNYDKTFG